MSQVQAVIEQIGPSTSRATVRTHTGLIIDRPTTKGGADRGPMGGEYLLVALGGCFMSNLLAAARARDAAISNARVSVTGTIEGTPERYTMFTLNVSATCTDPEMLPKLVIVAERACIVASTLKEVGPISVVLEQASAGETVKA